MENSEIFQNLKNASGSMKASENQIVLGQDKESWGVSAYVVQDLFIPEQVPGNYIQEGLCGSL